MKVTIVLEREFGAREYLPLGDAFWLVASPENCDLAEKLWRKGSFDPNSVVFDGDGYATADDAAAVTFFDVLEHHPMWDEIEFVGVPLSASIYQQLTNAERVTLTLTTDGFLVSRGPRE